MVYMYHALVCIDGDWNVVSSHNNLKGARWAARREAEYTGSPVRVYARCCSADAMQHAKANRRCDSNEFHAVAIDDMFNVTQWKTDRFVE